MTQISQLDWRVKSFAAIRATIERGIAASTPATVAYSEGPSVTAVPGAADRFVGGIALPTTPRRILLVPYSAGAFGFYEPDANTFTVGPAAVGSGRYANGCLTDEMLVVMPNVLATSLAIYDIKKNLFSFVATSGAFSSACQPKNGPVVLSPRGANPNIGLFDPKTKTFTLGPAHGQVADAFHAALPLPDGRVAFPPRNTPNVCFYDPSDNTFTVGPNRPAGTGSIQSAVPLWNGDFAMIPYGSDKVMIYRFESNTIYANQTSLGAGNKFSGGAIGPNGWVVGAPYDGGNILLYKPQLDEVATVTDPLIPTTGAFNGALPLGNGKIMLVPYNAANIGLVTVANGAIPEAARLSRYVNRC